MSPEDAVWEAVERTLQCSKSRNRTGDMFACHHLSSSGGTRATGHRPSASCLHYSCAAKQYPLFLSSSHREEEPKWYRRETVQSQKSGRGFVAWPSYTVHGMVRANAVPWERRRDLPYPRRVTGEPTLPQWVTSWGQQVTWAQGARAVPEFPLRPGLSFKRRREHVRHKSCWGKRANHKETSSLPSLTRTHKMVEIPILRYLLRRTMVSDAGEGQPDVLFDVRITLSFVLFSTFFFFTDLLSCCHF